MTPFQEELYRLIQDCKLENNAFTSPQEDVGNEITKLVGFSNEWDFKEKYDTLKKDNDKLQAELQLFKVNSETKITKSITQEIVPIIDDLFLLLSVSKENPSIYKTIKLLLVNIEGFLRRHEGGIIRPKAGEVFDPLKHKAVSVVETSSGQGSTIEEVYRAGFFIKNTVLREAEVKVRCAIRN